MHHTDLDRGDTDGVTVRCSGGDGGMADHTTATGTIDHGHGLAEFFFEQTGNDAGCRIGTPARTPWANHRDRTRRVVLRTGRKGSSHQGQAGNSAGNRPFASSNPKLATA